MATILKVAGTDPDASTELFDSELNPHRILHAGSAFEAILILTQETVDVLVVEDTLPDLDVIRFLLLARGEQRHLRVLMVADAIPAQRFYVKLVDAAISRRNSSMLLPMVELLVFTRDLAVPPAISAPLLSRPALRKMARLDMAA